MQITDATSTRLAPGADPVAVRSLGTLRPGAAYDTSVEPGNRLAIGRQALLRVLASEVVQALGGALDGAPRDASGYYGPQDAGGLGAAARALRAALRGGDAAGGDPVPGLLAKVETALGDARQTLQALGADPQEVAQATAQFRERVGGLVEATAAADDAAASLTAVSARHVRKERGSIELVTQDGDVVRIRFRSTEAERVGYAQAAAGGAAASSTRVETYSGTRIRVDVNGSLDEGELEAIRGFLGEVDALADRFFAGDVEQAFAQGAALEFDADEIARYALKLSVSERTDVQALRRVAPPAAAIAQPAGSPATTATPATSPAALPEAAPDAATPPPATGAAAPEPATPPNPQASAPATGEPSIRDTIKTFLERVFDAAQTPLSVRRYDVSWSVKIRIVAEAIDAARPASAEDASGAGLLLRSVLQNAAERDRSAAAH